MNITSGMSSTDELRRGSNRAFNGVLLAFLNSASEFDIIPIWRILYYMENYVESEVSQVLHINEDMVTNAFRTLREEGLVEGYLRPSPLHRATGSSLAIVLEQIPPKGLVPSDNKAFVYFQSVVNAEDELTRTPLKKTASNFELLKALINELLLNEEIDESVRCKAQALKEELT